MVGIHATRRIISIHTDQVQGEMACRRGISKQKDNLMRIVEDVSWTNLALTQTQLFFVITLSLRRRCAAAILALADCAHFSSVTYRSPAVQIGERH
jgi:hypothetical protein